MTATKLFPGSHQQIKLLSVSFKKHIQVTAHYTVHIGIAPSFQTDRKTRKYHYQRYASLPHATAALFARHSSLTALTSIPDFSIPSYTLPHKMEAGSSWRVRIAAPHIPHVPYVFAYSIIKVHTPTCVDGQKSLCLFWIKSSLDLPAQKAHKHSPPAMNGSIKIMCFSGMASS